jgi:hypothetical protein
MVSHEPSMNILSSHLVLKAKRDTAGAIIKYKARLVAGGDAQVHGLDFDQSYALLCAAKDETSVEFMRPLLN